MCPLQGPGGCSSSPHVSIGGQVAVVLMCPLQGLGGEGGGGLQQ